MTTAPHSKDAASTQLTFTTYPHPEEFLRDGGLPGVDYLYVHAKNGPKAQTEGWSTLHDVPMFSINNVPAMLMGRGRPSPNGRPGAVRCHYSIDKDLVREVGLPVPNFSLDAMTAPDPKPTTPPPSTNPRAPRSQATP